MNTQHFSPPPNWLPLRVLLSSVIAASVLLLAQHRSLSISINFEVPAPGLWVLCGSSLIILGLSLLLAMSIALAVGLLARRIGPLAEKAVAVLGRALACLPIAMVAWGFIGLWIGRFGLPVESLMPAQLPEAQAEPQAELARLLWEILAPVLILAIPFSGEAIHAVITDATATVDLEHALRVRGVPAASRLWHHHLRQLLPLLRVRMQSLCLLAPVYLIIVEDALRFMGWGGWMAQIIRAGDVEALARGLLAGGVMIALLCACLMLLRGKVRSSSGWLSAVAWNPWFLWVIGLMALPLQPSLYWMILWLTVLLAGCASWYRAWLNVEDQLPTVAARCLGASEAHIWRVHIAVVQLRMLIAWICAAFAQTLLWIAVVCAVQPRLFQELGGVLASLCRPLAISSMQDAAQTLADPTALLQAGSGLALAALCLIQVSRIVKPRPY